MKRFLLMLVICVSSFMIYTNNVKADTYYPGYSNTNSATCSNGTKSYKGGFAICNITNNSSNFNTITEYYIESTLNNNNNINKKDMLLNLNVIAYSGSNNLSFDTIDINENGTGTIIKSGEGELMPYYIDQDFRINAINGNIRTAFYNIRIYVVDDNNQGFVSNCKLNNTNSLGFNNVTCPITKDMSGSNTLKFRVYFSVYNSNFTNIQIGYHYDVYYSLDSNNAISNNTAGINNNTNEIKNDIKSDNVSGAEGSADDLKNNSAFQDNTGLSGVISMPLTFVNSLTNTCQPINLNIPYMDVDVTIPCMQSVITDKMPLLANLIKIIVNGFIVYKILLDIFQIVRNAKNPEDDRIEVLDL